jgi:hypothetical protein
VHVDDDADEETARLEELRRIKRATLHELDKQAAQYTAMDVPPHIQTERQRLRRELGMVESVIASPLSAAIGDELGEGNRYIAYIELMRQGDKATLEAVARLEEQIVAFIRDRFEPSERNSMLWRRWGAIALIIIVIVVVAMALIGVYQLGRFDGSESFVGDLLALWR